NRFYEKLAQDGFARGTEGHTHPDFASAFANADEHNVHHTEAAEEKRGNANATHENFHSHDNHAVGLRVFHCVPNACRFFVTWIEIVEPAESAANLAHAVLVRFKRPRSDQKPVNRVFDGWWLVRKITTHSIKRDEHFARVESIVAGVLFFGL